MNIYEYESAIVDKPKKKYKFAGLYYPDQLFNESVFMRDGRYRYNPEFIKTLFEDITNVVNEISNDETLNIGEDGSEFHLELHEQLLWLINKKINDMFLSVIIEPYDETLDQGHYSLRIHIGTNHPNIFSRMRICYVKDGKQYKRLDALT